MVVSATAAKREARQTRGEEAVIGDMGYLVTVLLKENARGSGMMGNLGRSRQAKTRQKADLFEFLCLNAFFDVPGFDFPRVYSVIAG